MYAPACATRDDICKDRRCSSALGVQGELVQVFYAPAGTGGDIAGSVIKNRSRNDPRLAKYQRGGTYCSSEVSDLSDGDIIEQLTVTVTNEDFRSLNVLPSALNGQGSGHTLKNFNTNLWATPQEQVFSMTINGRSVQVVATPVSYIFDYGDGVVVESGDPGYGLPQERQWEDVPTVTSHVYGSTGDFWASVTTVYVGRYSVEGGPWLQVAGVNEVVSESRLVRVWAVESGRVAQESGVGVWGCADG